jgi:hypothetical protein
LDVLNLLSDADKGALRNAELLAAVTPLLLQERAILNFSMVFLAKYN